MVEWLAQEQVSDNSTEWISLFLAIGSALGAVIAGLVAARSASRLKKAELEAIRHAELQRRLGSSRSEIYGDFIEMFRKLFQTAKNVPPGPAPEIVETISKFSTWVQMYGSDAAVIATHKFQQAAFSGAPSEISLRLFADLMLAARRDLGDEATKLKGSDLMGLLLKDLYTGYEEVFVLPEEELFEKFGWEPPWRERDSRKRAAPSARANLLRTGGLSLIGNPRAAARGRRGRAGVMTYGGLDLLAEHGDDRWTS